MGIWAFKRHLNEPSDLTPSPIQEVENICPYVGKTLVKSSEIDAQLAHTFYTDFGAPPRCTQKPIISKSRVSQTAASNNVQIIIHCHTVHFI